MTDKEWLGLHLGVARKYGEDAAQQAIVKLLEHLATGVEVHDPVGWCRVTAKRWLRDMHNHEVREVHLPNMSNEETEVVNGPFIDERSPERIATAREQLEWVSPSLIELTLLREEEDVGTQRRALRPVPYTSKESATLARERALLREEVA